MNKPDEKHDTDIRTENDNRVQTVNSKSNSEFHCQKKIKKESELIVVMKQTQIDTILKIKHGMP